MPDLADAFATQHTTTNRQQSYHGFRPRFLAALRAAGLADSPLRPSS